MNGNSSRAGRKRSVPASGSRRKSVVLGDILVPDSPSSLNDWFLSLRPEKRLAILFERIEMIMAIRRQMSGNGRRVEGMK